MIRRYWKQGLLSSLCILLPIPLGLLLLDRFPEQLATHFDLSGQADGWSEPLGSIFLTPLLFLATQWLCIGLFALDRRNRDQHPKLMATVLWLMPLLSIMVSLVTYALALDWDVSVPGLMTACFGIMFLLLGNYMPKSRPNRTIGIRVPWTLQDDENWVATHRFGGRLWFFGGLILLPAALLPDRLCLSILVVVLVVLSVGSTLYSYLFYRRKLRAGLTAPISLHPLTLVLTVLFVLFLAVILFTGSIQIRCDAESFTIEASYYDDLTVPYAAIDDLEYREGNIDGTRTWGYGSMRLLMGRFENQEFGSYIRYTYYAPESCVIVTLGDEILVLSGRNAEESRQIYETLLSRAPLTP